MNGSSASRAEGAPAGRAMAPDGRSALPATPGRSDTTRLARIRALHAAIAPGRHLLAFDAEGALIVADGTRGEKLEIVRFLPIASDDERDFLAGAAEAVGFLLGLVDRAISFASRVAPPPAAADPPAGRRTGDGGQSAPRPAADAPNFAAEAAIKCAEPAFKAFLMDKHGLETPATDERTAQRLRTLLGISSRAELNTDADAAARWKQLRGAFENWKRVGR